MSIEEIRQECEDSLYVYAQIMFPNRYFGDVHRDMFMFFEESLKRGLEEGQGDNSAALIPRDHQKSFGIAVACSWAITKFPWFTVTYVSSNPKLSQRQLTIIKNIFKSEAHRELWPQMMNYEIHQKTKQWEHKPTGTWTLDEISIDHPERPKDEKDPTVAATSAKSTNTGAHYKMCIFDDLVTNENYASSTERQAIKEVYQSYASIVSAGSIKWMVGTRYGDSDLYGELKEIEYEVFDENNEHCIATKPLWNWFERTVEDSKHKDGSGNYLWPRQKWTDNQWYGFNRTELSKKRSESFNLPLFYSQYYNDPNAAAVEKITNDCFMYMQPKMLEQRQGKWWYGNKELKVFCGMDLAFSEGSGARKVKRDYTAIAVIAWDADGYLYILDLQRFQTADARVYYDKVIQLHQYWNFREVTVETNAGGNVIANFVQDEVRKAGETLVVKHQTKNQREGSKEERNAQLFEPLYRGKSVYHTKGGYTRLLEEELRLSKPPHDDLKDALWIAVTNSTRMSKPKFATNRNRNVVKAESRFLNRGRKRA
jgi:hypothetical protein